MVSPALNFGTALISADWSTSFTRTSSCEVLKSLTIASKTRPLLLLIVCHIVMSTGFSAFVSAAGSQAPLEPESVGLGRVVFAPTPAARRPARGRSPHRALHRVSTTSGGRYRASPHADARERRERAEVEVAVEARGPGTRPTAARCPSRPGPSRRRSRRRGPRPGRPCARRRGRRSRARRCRGTAAGGDAWSCSRVQRGVSGSRSPAPPGRSRTRRATPLPLSYPTAMPARRVDHGRVGDDAVRAGRRSRLRRHRAGGEVDARRGAAARSRRPGRGRSRRTARCPRRCRGTTPRPPVEDRVPAVGLAVERPVPGGRRPSSRRETGAVPAHAEAASGRRPRRRRRRRPTAGRSTAPGRSRRSTISSASGSSTSSSVGSVGAGVPSGSAPPKSFVTRWPSGRITKLLYGRTRGERARTR